MSNSQAIGIFDSGIGGLTVMKQIMHKLPHEKLIYFGDSARLPYGDKSADTILRYSIENAIFLMEHQIKLLVIACNTASAYAVDKLKQILKIPIVDVIQPGVEHAAKASRHLRIGVLATRATTESGIYPQQIKKKLPSCQVYSMPCPLLVPLIEEHLFDHPATQLIIKDYLAPLKQSSIDTLLLGCTHYPLLRPLIQKEIGPHVYIVDSASTCAEHVSLTLDTYNLHASPDEKPSHRFYVSDYPEKFRLHGSKFLGHPIDKVNIPLKMKFEI
ncbi:glutamate racemase [Neochlamydia sp. S13]|uniref:glutamate racemase n=1 Tax=Neochlamydia sp. S13 TaxID=1353976 RepID=UPI0005A9B0A0|nr:glutamate racemase [Neochlamydia sp. S13]BBI18064.1 Glutamate racemase [Neochlamydia sp. S13]